MAEDLCLWDPSLTQCLWAGDARDQSDTCGSPAVLEGHGCVYGWFDLRPLTENVLEIKHFF